MATGVLQLAVMAPNTMPLAHSRNRCDIMTAMVWTNCHSTTSFSVTSALLQHQDFHIRAHAVTYRVSYLPGEANALSGTASCRWDLTDELIFKQLNFSLTQRRL